MDYEQGVLFFFTSSGGVTEVINTVSSFECFLCSAEGLQY